MDKTYKGVLKVVPATDFVAFVDHLSYDAKQLTLVLNAQEHDPNEPNWTLDCTLPWQSSVFRGHGKLVYAPAASGEEVDEPSPATIAARVRPVDGGLSVELMIHQADGDNGFEDKWSLTGVLPPA